MIFPFRRHRKYKAVSDMIRIGTRGSQLALHQTEWVAARIRAGNPGINLDITVIRTVGDQVQDRPLDQLGVQGAFTKELDQALIENRVDLVVHSLKDQPTRPAEGLVVAAMPERVDPRDVFIGHGGIRLADMKAGARIGTSSLRRRAQLTHLRPDVTPLSIRGNVDTRLRKLKQGEYDGIILAAAGLKRLGLDAEITEHLEIAQWLPAPGQGVLAVMTRADDDAARAAAVLEHGPTRVAATAERALLARVEGGCHVPVGAHAHVTAAGRLVLEGLVADLAGERFVREAMEGAPGDARALGEQLAERLLANGGAAILAQLQENQG